MVLRTETATFFREPDANSIAEIHAGPVNYRRPDGTWAEIDPTLVPASDLGYAWKNKSGPLAVEFAPAARDSDMVLVRGEDGTSLRFGLSSASTLSVPVIAGSKIAYPNVYPGVDVVFEVRNDDLKEMLVLKQRPKKAVSYRFPLARTGLTARQEPSGEISLLDQDGRVAFLIPHAWMTDAAVDPHSAEPARSDAVALSLDSSGTVLTVMPDFTWLQDPARVYPVTIDPSVTKDTTLDTFIQSNIVGGNSTSTELKTGTYDGGGTKARSLFKFDVSSLNGKEIISANFSIYEKWSWSCSARQVNAYRITESWSSSVDWSPQPAIHTPAFDTTTAAKGFSSSCPAGRITFDAAGPVSNWTNGTYTNYGIELRAASETDNYYWKKYDSVETANDPYLSISYDSYPTAPTSLSPAAGTINTSATRTTPMLSAIYNDPDSGDTGHVNYQVCSTSSCSAVVASGSGTLGVNPGAASPWTVPAGKLVSGVQYWWRAQGDDGRNVGSWTATRSYVPNQPPPAPDVLAPNTGLVTSLTPRLVASYQDPDPSDSGHVHFEVYDLSTNALVGSGEGTTALPGEVSTWTLSSGMVDGRSYYWRASSTDGWQSSPIESKSFLVSVGGDVYHATVYSGDPSAGGVLLTEEWARINTQTGRAQDADLISTRQTVTCPAGIPYAQCEQAKTVSADPDPQGFKDYSTYTARERHPDLHNVATILEPALGGLPPLVSSGSLSSVLASWQTAPPVSGATYEEYGETDSETGNTDRVWIEARTKLPLKATVTSPTGEVLDAVYWTYEAQRISTGDLPADFFAVVRPTNVGMEEAVEFHGNEAIGPITDDETGVSFRAYDLGATATVRATDGSNQTLCFSDLMIVHESIDSSELETLNEPDSEIEPDPFAPEKTYAFANYDPMPADGVCQPGVGTEADPVLTVAAVADTSTIAVAARDEMIDPATSIEANPQDPDYPRAGVRDATVQARVVQGYVVTTGDEQAAALLEPADVTTLLVINGDFDKTTMPEFSPALQPR